MSNHYGLCIGGPLTAHLQVLAQLGLPGETAANASCRIYKAIRNLARSIWMEGIDPRLSAEEIVMLLKLHEDRKC
jgi:hypothetical protein